MRSPLPCAPRMVLTYVPSFAELRRMIHIILRGSKFSPRSQPKTGIWITFGISSYSRQAALLDRGKMSCLLPHRLLPAMFCLDWKTWSFLVPYAWTLDILFTTSCILLLSGCSEQLSLMTPQAPPIHPRCSVDRGHSKCLKFGEAVCFVLDGLSSICMLCLFSFLIEGGKPWIRCIL